MLPARDNDSHGNAFPHQRRRERCPDAVFGSFDYIWKLRRGGGEVIGVDPASRTVSTAFGTHKADVANVIPPQRAGALAATVGVAEQTGWCPVESVAFESRLRPGIHVIGDAAIMGGMPKSAFAANAQANAEEPNEPLAELGVAPGASDTDNSSNQE